MGITLPGELADLLNELGYIWPKSDETQLFELGADWLSLGSSLSTVATDAETAARKALAVGQGDALQAFDTKWAADDSGAQALSRGVTGAEVVGAALMVCAAVVLALKINVIVQLTILLIEIIQAIATAPETFGGSLLEVPVFKKITDMIINFIINEAMEVILG
jgi:hypothetical protein